MALQVAYVCMIGYKEEAPVYYTTMTEKKRD